MKTVNEVCVLVEVSIRTLHYYDKIGLLKPSKRTEKGYRLYTDDDVKVLQQILLFKELGLNLKSIKAIITSSDYDQKKVLESQKMMLTLKKNRLDYLINQVELTQKNEEETIDFGENDWELIWNEIYIKQGEIQSEVLEPVEEFIKTIKSKGLSKVLDLGCGTGRNTLYLLSNGFDVTASDISAKGLEITKAKANKRGFELNTSCHDMRSMPFKDNTFEAILCSWVCGHGNHEDMLNHAKEMIRVVKPGGLIFVDYPSTEDKRFGIGTQVDENTFIDNMPGEEKIPHHYSTVEEIETVYSDQALTIQPYTYYFSDSTDQQHEIKAYIAIVEK